jgi:DNA primase
MSDRAKRIKEKISLERVLSDYGYNVREIGGEQQFRCDLHGDGSDNAPSARVYPQSNTFYCFACGRARDSITLVMEKEGVEFGKACFLLEKKYGLTTWVSESKKPEVETRSEIESPVLDFSKLIRGRLWALTKQRQVSLSLILRLWEGYDLLCSRNEVSDSQWKRLLEQIPSLKQESEYGSNTNIREDVEADS